jgi:EmrB/QacA subfamily drug resistance transporter
MQTERSQHFVEIMAVVVTILGTGMVYLDQTAVNVALPKLQESLNVDVAGLQWFVDVYILTLAVLLLIGGALGDIYGRVRVFIIGMIIFMLASFVCGFAGSLEMLIFGRALQGVGGALLLPGGLAMINAVVADERRGQMLGLWGTFSPLVTASGPAVGGWMVDNLSWRAVFFMNIPLGLIAWYVAGRYMPETKDEHASGKLDWLGVFTMMAGLGGLLFGLIEGPNLGWGHPLVVGTLAVGVIGLVGFCLAEAYGKYPMMPLHLFRNVSFSGINLMTLLFYFAASSVFYFVSLNLQQVQGFTAFQAGLAQLPATAVLILCSRYVGKLTDRIGAMPLMVAGVVITCAGYYLYAVAGLGRSFWVSFLPASVVFGLGMVVTFIPLTAVALNSLPRRYSGIASGFNTAVSRVGQMMAVALLGAAIAGQFRASLAQQTTALGLEPAAQAQLLAEARNLGATVPPAGLAPDMAEAVRQAVRVAFVDGFSLVQWISLAMTALCLLILLAIARWQPAGAVAEAPGPAEAAAISGD